MMLAVCGLCVFVLPCVFACVFGLWPHVSSLCVLATSLRQVVAEGTRHVHGSWGGAWLKDPVAGMCFRCARGLRPWLDPLLSTSGLIVYLAVVAQVRTCA